MQSDIRKVVWDQLLKSLECADVEYYPKENLEFL